MVNFKYIIVFGEKILYIFLVIFLILLMLKDKKKKIMGYEIFLEFLWNVIWM